MLKQRRTLWTAIATLCFLNLLWAGSFNQWADSDYLLGRVLVTFDESVGAASPQMNQGNPISMGIPELDEIFSEYECRWSARLVPDQILDRLIVTPHMYRTYVIVFRSEYPVRAIYERLTASSYVDQVEPDLLYHIARTPNDPSWNSQWDKQIMGAPMVWDVNTGNPDIICCGLDTGVDWQHPDLTPVLWVNPEEDLDGDQVQYVADFPPYYPGDYDDLNGVDDGDNGYPDDFLGWDFIVNIGGCATGEDCDNMMDNDMFGMEAHGTHVGGIMAAQGNNGRGVSGFTWVGRLMALRTGYLDNQGQGYMPQSATIPGTYYAVANGARILNMSYGSGSYSGQAQTACTDAWNNGALLFGASGNDNVSSPHYPAGNENVVSVNATDQNDHKAGFSNYGTWTDVSAPGVSIPSTVNNGGYQSWDGTSMASPNAAGAAALLWGMFPSLTNAQVRDLIINSAEDIDAENPGYAGLLGSGRVDVENAASGFIPRLSVIATGIMNDSFDNDGRLETGETGQLILTFYNHPDWAAAQDISVSVSASDSALSVSNGEFSLGTISPGQSVSNQATPVTLTASSFEDAFWTDLRVSIIAGNGYATEILVPLRVGRGLVLLVDDDNGAAYQSYFYNELFDLGVNPDMWTSSLDGEPTLHDLQEYQGVIWSCGDDQANSLTDTEQTLLASYLDAGGKLLISGQGIRNDISGTTFFSNYLHAATDADAPGDRVINGIEGNLISGGMDLLLLGGGCAGNGQLGPDRILPVGDAIPAFEYTSVGGVGAVMYSGAYKVLYCAFALEAACGLAGSNHFRDVFANTMAWWEISDADERGATEVPSSLRLLGNFPNPFNPTTEIRFELATSSRVTLKVYDLLGREVVTLVDGLVPAGAHTERFDAAGLPSGMYLARLTSGEYSQTTKMILLK